MGGFSLCASGFLRVVLSRSLLLDAQGRFLLKRCVERTSAYNSGPARGEVFVGGTGHRVAD